MAVPDSVHEPTIRAALDSGVPFLYEPPVADQADRVRPLLRDLLAAPQVTHADLELAYLPVLLRLRELVAAGEVGEPQTASIRLHAAWTSTANTALGLVYHLAPWYLEALDRAVGARPSRILVLDGRGTPGRMQTYATAILDYAGVWGTFQANLAAAGYLQIELEVNGAGGDVAADLLKGQLRVRTSRHPHWRLESVSALGPEASWPGMHECVRAFLDAVESGEPSQVGPETVAAQHLAGLAAEASMDSGGWAAIPSVDELRSPAG
jgi:predicted dehydrogenase